MNNQASVWRWLDRSFLLALILHNIQSRCFQLVLVLELMMVGPTALYKFCNQIAVVFYDFSWSRKLPIRKLILIMPAWTCLRQLVKMLTKLSFYNRRSAASKQPTTHAD